MTHLQSFQGSIYKVKLSREENLRMLEKTGNQRGLYVKLADHMHNMRMIDGHHTLAKQQQVAKETMQFYVPMAERLGLHGYMFIKGFSKTAEPLYLLTQKDTSFAWGES